MAPGPGQQLKWSFCAMQEPIPDYMFLLTIENIPQFHEFTITNTKCKLISFIGITAIRVILS